MLRLAFYKAMKYLVGYLLLFLCLPQSMGQQHATKNKIARTKPKKKVLEEGEYPNPFIGKPFKPDVPRTLNLIIPVGDISIYCRVRYSLYNDAEGLMFSCSHRYRAQIVGIDATGPNISDAVKEILGTLADTRLELTEQEVMSKTLRVTELYYWFTVKDFNLDGKPDLAIIEDKGYHSNLIYNYVWVNIGNKLEYWMGLSGRASHTANKKERIVCIEQEEDWKLGHGWEYYKVVKDTALMKVEYKEE